MGETFVAVSSAAPVLRVGIDNYLKRSGVSIAPDHEADHLSSYGNVLDSIDARRRAFVCLRTELSVFVCNESSLKGDTPTVDPVLGYKKSNRSPILKLLLSRLDDLVARVSK